MIQDQRTGDGFERDGVRANTFEEDWRFFLGDEAAACRPEYDDGHWRRVMLPHDWSIEGAFDPQAPCGGGGGYLPTGVGWYRKTFPAAGEADLRHFLCFDGVYMNSDVWINGHYLGRRPSGYTPFEHDITPFLVAGGRNVAAIRVDNSFQPNSRWYTGSGINRHVHLRTRPCVHIHPWGCSVETTAIGPASAAGGIPQAAWAEVAVSMCVRVGWFPESRPAPDWERAPGRTAARAYRLTVRAVDAEGASVGEWHTGFRLREHSQKVVTGRMRLDRPCLWSPESPFLYRLQCTLRVGDAVVDAHEFPLGVRTAAFDADRGFLLNGAKTVLRGVCLHHDAGCLGSAVPERAWRRRLGQLKEMGCNALRLSHCPFPGEVYDLCDELGFLVMDEAFDEWNEGSVAGWRQGTWGKCDSGYHLHFDQWAEADLRAMIRRDRRHPCVVIYSVGNEIPEQGRPEATGKLRRLRRIVREEDQTRPVTMGCDLPWLAERTGLMDLLDVAGYNYVHRRHPDYYAALHREHPTRKLLGTETHTYFDYWRAVRDNPAVAGEFLWAGVDYLGEAEWPRVMSVPAPINTCGMTKPHFWHYRALWSDRPTVFLTVERPGAKAPAEWDLPDVQSHWDWDRVDAPLKVFCYSNCEQVELLLNGRSQGAHGRAADGSPVFCWQVCYEPGSLTAVGRAGGTALAEHTLRTAGPPYRLAVHTDTTVLAADGRDVAHLEVSVVDAEGVPIHDREAEVSATVSGPGQIAGMSSADPCGHTPYSATTHRTHQGRVLVVVRGRVGELGTLRVELSSPCLRGAVSALTCV